MDPCEIADAVKQELTRRGATPYRAALDAGMPGNAIRYVLEGRATKSDRLAEIARALGLEFYIGPPREIAIPAEITEALDLSADTSVDDAVRAIKKRGGALDLDTDRLNLAIKTGVNVVADVDINADIEQICDIIAAIYKYIDDDDDTDSATIVAAKVIGLSEFQQQLRSA